VAANHEILALFDLDGTLLRVGDEVHHAAFEHATRAALGATIAIGSFDLAGAVDRRLYHAAAEQAGVSRADALARYDSWVAVVGRYYTLRVSDGDRADWVLPGVGEVLRKLRATGIAMAIATGSVREVAEAKLVSAGLKDYFPSGAYGDEVSSRADLIRRALQTATAHHSRKFLAANAVVIGDTPADIAAARETGARILAVATGRFSAEELDEHGPDATFADLTNADAVIKVIREGNVLGA
jgi:beta-phosphoglucomutase-like phosphatase (HAD superfamily)